MSSGDSQVSTLMILLRLLLLLLLRVGIRIRLLRVLMLRRVQRRRLLVVCAVVVESLLLLVLVYLDLGLEWLLRRGLVRTIGGVFVSRLLGLLGLLGLMIHLARNLADGVVQRYTRVLLRKERMVYRLEIGSNKVTSTVKKEGWVVRGRGACFSPRGASRAELAEAAMAPGASRGQGSRVMEGWDWVG